MGVKELLAKWRNQREERQSIEKQQRAIELMEEKKLSANERELQRFQKQDYDAKVKTALENYRKRENDEVWSGRSTNPLYAQNVVAGQKELFKIKKQTKHTNLFFK